MTEKLLVTDTHPLVWFFCDGGRKLSKKARAAFEEAIANGPTAIFVPSPVLWEISILLENNYIQLNKTFADWVDYLFQYHMINPAPLDQDTVKQIHNLRFHNDPFDKAIVAVALQMGLPLITNDTMMHNQKPCKLFWY